MNDTDVELGPIDYLVVEWPAGEQPSGEGLPLLVDLVDRGVIRVLDIAFVRKDDDGTVVGLDLSEFDGDPVLTVFEGASSGLLGDDDYTEAGAALEPGCSAALLVYENRWAAPFATGAFAATAPSWSPTAASPSRRSSLARRADRRRSNDMPGLLRGVARTAAIAGTATAVSRPRLPPPGQRGRSRNTRPAGLRTGMRPPSPGAGRLRHRRTRGPEGTR